MKLTEQDIEEWIRNRPEYIAAEQEKELAEKRKRALEEAEKLNRQIMNHFNQ